MRLLINRQHWSALVLVGALSLATIDCGRASEDPGAVIGEFLLLLLGTPEGKREAREWVSQHWEPGFTPMMIEVLTFNRDPAFGGQLVALLEEKTGQGHGYDINRWHRWQWNQEQPAFSEYADFKAALYGLIDPAFEAYFSSGRKATIRLDEVLWGGVAQDGIPPLRNPEMIAAAEAAYLAEHELYQDRIGVVLTDDSGANRVYEAADREFASWDGDRSVRDSSGLQWRLEEGRLVSDDGRELHRLPAQRAFWFGWFSAYNHTRLVR